MTLVVHSCCYCSACRARVLLRDGCLHGLPYIHLCIVKCAEYSMVLGFLDESLACCSLFSCCKAWQAHLFVKVHVRCIRFLRMLHPFVRWWTCSFACAPFVHLIHCLDMFVGVPVPVVTHDVMTSNPKPLSLPWHMIIQMWVAERGSKAMMQDDGFRKLLMKTMQESLRDRDRRSESTVTNCKV